MKEAKPKEREICKWSNAETKKLKLPEELAAALTKTKKMLGFSTLFLLSTRKDNWDG